MSLSLSAAGLSKSFGSLKVFSRLEFSVFEGETLIVAGSNGSGKSTLLKILGGLLTPSAGSVELLSEGRKIPPERRRHFLFLVAPDWSFYEELTARENLKFFLALLNRPAGQLDETLNRAGLGGREKDEVAGFSLGMRQRLKYALALLLQPKILLLDEPTANLDESGRKLVAELLTEQKKRGAAIIATNEPAEYAWGEKKLELGR